MLFLDPRGELAAISHHVHAMHGEQAYYFNPYGLHGLAQPSCNPLDILDPASPTFHADCKFIARALIAVTSQAEGKYFEQRGSGWLEALLKIDVEMQGYTSLPSLMRIVNLIESGRGHWLDFLEVMLKSSFDDVRRTAGEMLAKQQDSQREFGSIVGEIYANLGFLDDPMLQASLERSDFSLSALCDAARTSKVFVIVPAEYLKIFAPLLRLFFTTTLLYKSRAPSAPRVTMVVDEAGQLGSFDALVQAYTYGRGAGVRPWAIFQDAGQIVRNFGAPGLQSLIGSAQMRQFFGVRDFQTAQLVSNMLGGETLEYDDTRMQEQARRQKMQAVQRLMGGEDPFSAMLDVAHFNRTAQMRTKQARKLMTDEEILSMPEDRQILFVSGKDLPPIYAQKFPYFLQPSMAGLYLPNPYHPPYDRVQIATRWGTGWARVIHEPLPPHLTSFAQYQNGTLSYVEGYKPT